MFYWSFTSLVLFWLPPIFNPVYAYAIIKLVLFDLEWSMYISTPLMHLKEVCQMLISLLLLYATKSKLYVHFLCF